MRVCNCSMFYRTLLYVHSIIAIILMGVRELVVLLNLSSWCLVMVEWLFLAAQWGCLRFMIVVLSDHNHLLFCMEAIVFNESWQMWSKYFKRGVSKHPCTPSLPPHTICSINPKSIVLFMFFLSSIFRFTFCNDLCNA